MVALLGVADEFLRLIESSVGTQIDVRGNAITVTGQPVSLIPGLTLPAIERTLTGPIERWVPAP